MKTKSFMQVMGLLMVVGCVTTFLFVDFHNKQISQRTTTPKIISYDEVSETAFNNLNALVASQENSDFIKNVKKELLDLRMTKEIHQHQSNNTIGFMSVYPLLILWAAISIIGFMLLRVKESKDKSIARSYEKILDHLEMSYSQEHQTENSSVKNDELIQEFKQSASEEV